MINTVLAKKFSNNMMVKFDSNGNKECKSCIYAKDKSCPLSCQVIYKKLMSKIKKGD